VKKYEIGDGSERSASCLGRCTPEGKAPGGHCLESWVDPSVDLDAVAKRKCHFLFLPGIEICSSSP